MKIALGSKSKLGFIDGSSLPKPNSDDPIMPLRERCNLMAISWILNIVSKETAGKILFLSLAYQMWLVLGIFEIQRELNLQTSVIKSSSGSHLGSRALQGEARAPYICQGELCY